MRALAPGKVNLCLLPRADARPTDSHELVSTRLAAAGALADRACALEPAPAARRAGRDRLRGRRGPEPRRPPRCAPTARASGWNGPPVRLTIVKRVPVAAGMGGGSGDAAAALRLAAHAAGRPRRSRCSGELAPRLGADVPGQVDARAACSSAAPGEEVERARRRARRSASSCCPRAQRLSTPDVYREADRLGLRATGRRSSPRGRRERRAARSAAGPLPPARPTTSQAAARSLCPAIDDALAAARAAGADHALVSGSGPTVVGLFAGPTAARAARAARLVGDATPERSPPGPARGRGRPRDQRAVLPLVAAAALAACLARPRSALAALRPSKVVG